MELSPKGLRFIRSETSIFLKPYAEFKTINHIIKLNYMKYGNKWYPFYISHEFVYLTKLKVTGLKDELTYNIKYELLVTKVDTTPALKIDKDKVIDKNFKFSDHEKDYDPDVWNNFTTIKPENDLEKQLKNN